MVALAAAAAAGNGNAVGGGDAAAAAEGLARLDRLERHARSLEQARRIGDWEALLREADAAAVHADLAPQVLVSRAEALLKLRRPEEADAAVTLAQKAATTAKGLFPNAVVVNMRARVDIALGRFEAAAASTEAALRKDPESQQLAATLKKARSLAQARVGGNDLFREGNYVGAAAAYGEGLSLDPGNAVLLCNRSACLSKLGQWQEALQDCNVALREHPHYTKALLRRANCLSKLERWPEALRDYEALAKQMPGDGDVEKGLIGVQVALKKAMAAKYGLEGAADITSEEQYADVKRAALAVVDFSATWCGPCKEIAPLVTRLSKQFPACRFFKVDIDEMHELAVKEGIKSVPTFKAFRNGQCVKVIVGADASALETIVRQYTRIMRVEF
eukprot:SM000042S15360  [mRNA]  locus=s42:491016:493211:- [translate_table: standard]